MKDVKSRPQTRLTQVAEELHRLAESIGAGHVQISGVDLKISDSVILKVKQKMTGSKVIFDLKIQALLVSKKKRESGRTRKKQKTGKMKQRPYGVKALKKKYAGIWRMIATAIKKGEQPDRTAVLELDAVSKEYNEMTSPEWAILWQKSEILILQCVAAAQADDFVGANEFLREIGKVKKSCHKMYK